MSSGHSLHSHGGSRKRKYDGDNDSSRYRRDARYDTHHSQHKYSSHSSHDHKPQQPPQNQSHTLSSEHPEKGLPPPPDINEKYRKMVFTHPTNGGLHGEDGYDRLELLGDAYMESFAAQLIFKRCPDHAAGKQSQIREELVKNETIGHYSVLYGFDKQLKNYKNFQTGDPKTWLKIKGDIFEAYVAAIILTDNDDVARAKKWLHELWEPKLVAAAASNQSVVKKNKEELAKKLLMKGVKINYLDEKAPVVHYGQGKEEYFVGVYLSGLDWDNQYLGSGKGLSRMEAGQNAAAEAMKNPLTEKIAKKRLEVLAQQKEAKGKQGFEKGSDFISI